MTEKSQKFIEYKESSGVVVIFGTRNLKAFLIVDGNDAINYVYNSTDNELERHLREIGGTTYRILDEKFIDAVADSVAPICGNWYSYAMDATIAATAVLPDSLGFELARFEKISKATITDHNGKVICLDKFLA